METELQKSNGNHAPASKEGGGLKDVSHAITDRFDRMHELFDTMFSDYFRVPSSIRLGFGRNGDGVLLADMDLSETDDTVAIELDVPGVKEEDLDVKLSDDAIDITGSRKSETEEKKRNFHRVERSYGQFHRRISLPCDVERDQVDAKLKNGVLTIVLPKTAQAKERERSIKVKAE